MALNLKKGDKIDLKKKGDSLGRVLVGLGWDPVVENKGGFLKKLFSVAQDIDCDASVLMLEDGDKLTQKNDAIYFGNLRSKCESVVHTGDNLTGEGDGDDEQIYVELDRVPDRIKKLLFTVNIYNARGRGQHFGMINNCFVRVYDESNRKELCKFNIDKGNSGETALIIASVERDGGDWKFNALGEGTNDNSLEEIIRRYK